MCYTNKLYVHGVSERFEQSWLQIHFIHSKGLASDSELPSAWRKHLLFQPECVVWDESILHLSRISGCLAARSDLRVALTERPYIQISWAFPQRLRRSASCCKSSQAKVYWKFWTDVLYAHEKIWCAGRGQPDCTPPCSWQRAAPVFFQASATLSIQGTVIPEWAGEHPVITVIIHYNTFQFILDTEKAGIYKETQVHGCPR